MRAAVLEPVPLLGREVAAPVADLDVALQQADVQERMRVLVTHADILYRSSGNGVEGPVGEGAALAGWVLAFGRRLEGCEVGDVGGWELDFGLLLGGFVGGR